MASPFAEAIMQSMVASMDPTIAMQRDAMEGYLESQKNTLRVEKAKTAGYIGELLLKAKEMDPPVTALVETYEALLADLKD